MISDCKDGNGLDHRIREWVKQRAKSVHIKPNEASESERGISVMFSPDVSEWVTDTIHGYPVTRLRKYSFDEVLELNTDRIKSIEKLRQFFEQEVGNLN